MLTVHPAAILAQRTHRPWSIPARPWVIAQQWHHLLFAHWAVSPEIVRPLLPPDLPLDTFDGQAWIGVVPFLMDGVRAHLLPPIPGTATFPELNVRTYVVIGNRPGVWFFSLDAANRLAVEAARISFHLPYVFSRMTIQTTDRTVKYICQRADHRMPSAEFIATYRPISGVSYSKPGTLEYWLTERYCLYAADRHGHLYRGEIHHAPWPLQTAEADIHANTMAHAAGILLSEPTPLLHYAHRMDVLAWLPTRV